MAFEFTWTARSSSVDETDHLYYPELFRLVDEGIETMLEGMGYPLSRLILEQDRALPIVEAEAEFHSPIGFGDTVACTIRPAVGESSVRFRAAGTIDGERVFDSTIVRVYVELDSFEARPLPAEFRTRLAAYGDE